MKWFKHLTASRTDPDIGSILDRFGYKGYFMFFRTLEIMSDEFSVTNPAKNDFNLRWFLDQFPRNIDKKTLIEFFDYCQNSLEKKRIIYSLNKNKISINFPKLKDLTDDYTSRILRSMSEVSSDTIRSKSEVTPSHKIKEVRSKNIKEYSEDSIFLTNLLIEKIKENDPKAKVPEKGTNQYLKWIDNIRLCMERDGRFGEEVQRAILFSQEDDFWRGNILSTAKLRKQMQTLLLQSKRQGYKVSQVGQTKAKPTPEREKYYADRRAKEVEVRAKHRGELEAIRKKGDPIAGEALEQKINEEMAEWSSKYNGSS